MTRHRSQPPPPRKPPLAFSLSRHQTALRSGARPPDGEDVATRALGSGCPPGLLALGLLLLAGVLAGCEGWFEMSDHSDQVTIPGQDPLLCPEGWQGDLLPPELQGSVDAAFTQGLQSIQNRIESEIDRKNTGPVDAVRLTELTIQLESRPAEPSARNTLGFMQDLRLYLIPTRVGTRLVRRLLTQHLAVPPRTAALVTTTTSVNLEPYFEEGYRVEAEIDPRSCLAEDLIVRLTFTATVTYSP